MNRMALGAAFAVTLAAAGPAAAQTYSIGTLPQGSLAYTVGAAVARVVTEETGLQMRIVPAGGPDATIPQVQMGDLEFSIASSDMVAAAFAGSDQFSGHKMDGLRVVANLLPFSSGFIVRADSDIRALADLKGKRVAGQFPQQRVLANYEASTLATVGMSLDDVTVVPVPNGIRGVEAFMSGSVDAAIFSPGSGIVSQADASVGGVRFLGVPETEEADETIRKMTPGAYVATVIPRPNRPGIEGPTPMMSGTFVLFAGPQVSDEVVAKVAQAIWEKREALVGIFPGFREMTGALVTQPVADVPFQPAAADYFKSAGVGGN